jgi:hypothetical protein
MQYPSTYLNKNMTTGGKHPLLLEQSPRGLQICTKLTEDTQGENLAEVDVILTIQPISGTSVDVGSKDIFI